MDDYIVDNNNVSDFKNKMKMGSWIVWYFAPWCGHCKTMEPEWKQFLSVKSQTPRLKNLNCARVSDSMLPRLDEKYRNVSGFPTIKFFNKGNDKGDFKESRTSENFKLFSENNMKSSDVGLSITPSASINSRSKGSRSKGSRSKGSRSKGSRSKGSRSKGSRSNGSRSKGSRSKGSRSNGSRKKRKTRSNKGKKRGPRSGKTRSGKRFRDSLVQ
jgi:thiol-disulfide isomerase/thioredoxin